MMTNWNDTRTAIAHASGAAKLENRQSADQLASDLFGTHLPKIPNLQIQNLQILVQFQGVLQHSSPKGGIPFRLQAQLINH